MTLEYAASPQLTDVGILDGVSVNIALQYVPRVQCSSIPVLPLAGIPSRQLPSCYLLSVLLFFSPAPWRQGDPLGGAE